MNYAANYIWKQMPFVRLVIPLIAGILLQWYLRFSLSQILFVVVGCCVPLLLFYFLSFSLKFWLRWVQGIFLTLFVMSIGALIIYQQDLTHHKDWLGHYYKDSLPVLATLQEPLVEKAKSYKAVATIEAIKTGNEWQSVKGDVLLYFNKEDVPPPLKYGSQVLFFKPLQEIKNSGNPGSFDYKRYNAFQDIYHQVFLKNDEYVITGTTNINRFMQWLIDVRFAVIRTLDKYISSGREAGVAEALLIGYRDNLDKELVQAYSNTGVVHIIAISGLHLGMIYGVLRWMFGFFRRRKWVRWVKPVVILAVLWIFTFVAGGVPSIARSAVMFTFIVIAETINRKTSIYNTLAASAFVMLCYNPFFLWDVGFQLSYAAVISIIAFAKPIHSWIYITNKSLDFVWELVAVTLSAQILTLPIIFYYFHQFPNLFLLTNIVIVPLSSIILFAELLLLLVSPFAVIAKPVAFCTTGMLSFMNSYIERFNDLPFAVYNGIQNTVFQTIVLYVFIIALCYWLYCKSKPSLYTALFAGLVFITLQSFSNAEIKKQLKVIVYNIPKLQAIDFIEGKTYRFVGDTSLMHAGFLRNFHIQPARTLYKLDEDEPLKNIVIEYPFISFHNKKILLVDENFSFETPEKIPVDLIIISKNPRVYIPKLAAVFSCNQYVFDGSNSQWKINQWKKDCDSLHLQHYSTPDKGAFEWNL
jgi:competence protein ComEC